MLRNSADRYIEGSGRDVLLRAAIELVIERGIYRTTSNEIARRAGVTWGSIQHHFGSRDNLWAEVLEWDYNFYLALIDNADIPKGTTEERLRALYDVIDSYYGRRDYLATFEIRMALLSNEKRAVVMEEALQRQNDAVNAGWIALVHRALLPEELGEAAPLLVYEMFRAVASRGGLMRHYPESVRGQSAIEGLPQFAIQAVSNLIGNTGISDVL